MSTNPLNGNLGDAAHFAGDYLFRDKPLPNNATIHSEEHTLNNTLGRLQLTGTISKTLALTGTNSLTAVLQYKDDTEWRNLATLFSASGVATVPAGTLFEFVPPPNDSRRICRLAVTTNFDATAATLTAAVEILP